MTAEVLPADPDRTYFLHGPLGLVAKGLAGVIAVFVAVKTIAFMPAAEPGIQDHLIRLVAFAGLTVWATMCFGLKRRGAAAITVLAFASAVEWFVLPTRTNAPASIGTLVSANLGIVLAYCSLHLYWNALMSPDRKKASAEAA